MAGDDTTADPLFKNVPRRPRSVPRKEEPDGGDPSGDSGVSNNASPPAVASNKRRPSSTGGGAEHVPRAKKHRLAPIGVVGALDRRGILGGMPPVLSHKDKAAAAAAASSASSGEAEPDVDWAENERWRKGKTPVMNDEDDDPCAAVARRRRPPAGSGLGNKLLGDAIRSHRGGAAAVAVAGGFEEPSSRTTKPKKPAKKKKHRAKPKKEKPTKKDSGDWFWCGMGTGSDAVSSAGSDADYSFDGIGVVSDRLRTTLRGLGVGVAAPGPVRVYGKLLSASDRVTQQSRLLMSCKRWLADDAEFPICAFLTEGERREAHGEGLALTAYDRGGDAYELAFRFLKSNGAWRLIKNWGDFLKHNGLVVGEGEPPPAPVDDDVMLDLWLFRPPGRKVGMVVLHYRSGDAAHADAALEEVAQKRREEAEQKRLEEEEQERRQLMLNNGDAAGAGGNGNDDGNAVMEDVVGDANEDAGVMGEVAAAAAPAPSSPSSEPSGGAATEAAEIAGAPGEVAVASSPSLEPDGVGAKAAEDQQAGALGEVADAPSSTSSELHGGAGRSGDEVTAPLSLGGDGTEEEQEAGGALMVMVLEVEAVTQSSLLDSDAGEETNEVAAPPSSPEEPGGGAAMMATEDEAAAELEAAARSCNVTKCEYQAALGLVMLSEANS